MTFFEALATLFSLAALLASLATLYYSDKRMKKANQLTNEANRKLDKANELTTESLRYSHRQHKLSLIPQLEGRYQYFNISINQSNWDSFQVLLNNKSQSTLTILNLELFGVLKIKQPIHFPENILINEPYIFKVEMDYFSKNSFEFDEKIFEHRQQIENLMRGYLQSTIINIIVKDEIGTTYKILLHFKKDQNRYLGESIEVSQ